MLREYEETINSLTDIEKKLLEGPINRLNSALEPGYESLNLSSLGIPDFIDDVNKKIKEFRDIKKKVDLNAGHIEEYV